MDDRRKAMILELSEGKINHPALPILHFLTGFVRCDEILKWLINNRMTGNDVVFFVNYQFKRSQLDFAKWVLSKVDKDKELKRIYVGKDWNPKQ
jgi:hypothetical protein